MSERLDQMTSLPLGTRDAVHVPVISAMFVVDYSKGHQELKAGDYVKFVDEKFTKFVVCNQNESHGIINPFLDVVPQYEPVLILMKPGITTPVHHHFEIDLEKPNLERSALEWELEDIKRRDPDCADCWVIENNNIIRY